MDSFSSSGSFTGDPAHFSAQIIALDSYQSPPSPYLDKPYATVNGSDTQEPLTQVPIVRVYGKLKTGHTCLVHVHNVFPYLYIQYDGPHGDVTKIKEWLMKLKDEINLRLFLSFQRKQVPHPKKRKVSKSVDGEQEEVSESDSAESDSDEHFDGVFETRAFVADLSLVKAVPFYGYSVGWHGFVKVSLVGPRYVRRLANLLYDGKIMGTPLQPFESHIPMQLQFLKDYNLFCCNWLTLDSWYFRSPIVALSDTDNEELVFNNVKFTDSLKELLESKIRSVKGTNKHNILDVSMFPRMSLQMVELDSSAVSIVNLSQIDEHTTSASFEEFEQFLSGSQSEETSFLSSTKGMIRDAMYQRALKGLKDASKCKLFTGSQRDFSKEYWVERDSLNELFEYCCHLSSTEWLNRVPRKPELQDMLPKNGYLKPYCTAFESVIALAYHPENSSFILSESSDLHPTQVLQRHLSQKTQKLQADSSPKLSQNAFSRGRLEDIESKIEVTRHESADWRSPVKIHSELTSKLMNTEHKVVDTDWTILRSTQAATVTAVSLPNTKKKSKDSQAALMAEVCGPFGSDEMLTRFDDPPENPGSELFLRSLEQEHGLLQIEYTSPFYSNPQHVPERPFYMSGKKFVLTDNTTQGLDHYDVGCISLNSLRIQQLHTHQKSSAHLIFRFADGPVPSSTEVAEWCRHNPVLSTATLRSQIEFATPSNKNGTKYKLLAKPSQHPQSSFNSLSVLMMEVHVNSREDKNPDPSLDPICAIFWKFDEQSIPYDLPIDSAGCFISRDASISFMSQFNFRNLLPSQVQVFDDEMAMVDQLVELVNLVDPDILAGYEVHASSWGFVLERMNTIYEYDFLRRISRVNENMLNKERDRWGYASGTAFRVTGRHIVNLWRALRHAVTLTQYTLQNVAFHVLHERFPHFSRRQLTDWFASGSAQEVAFALSYYTNLLSVAFRIMDTLELVSKVTEECRLIGVDFYSILTRGSQFKVEGLLTRLAKTENFMLISPSRKQVFKQQPIQCIPLIMEPESAFYKSPLLVLDFQSLYPSMMIAYNMCYSTILGKLRGYNGHSSQNVGVGKVQLPLGFLNLMKEHINITPNGVMFLKQEVRKSLLARMLTEILDTRLLIKDTMSKSKDDLYIKSLYHNRQLALKLIANVTYGYASASFSGRMPCAEMADGIVSAGRETLNRAISEIERESEWGAKVVYGDTDSLFVYLPGKSKAEAFKIGKKMADHITSINPEPVKLKFEKVYHPCVLVSKKRYVGYSYEYEDQTEPKFDAKGIETVRRDGIPAQQKVLEKCLKLLFDTADVSKVRDYVERQFTKIMTGHFSIQDFCFAKEVRLGTYKSEIHAPPGAIISKRLMEADHRAEPQYRERVPYLVIKGRKQSTLRERCITPDEFIDRQVIDSLELDWNYYITKVLIPPLERVFNLMGVDVRQWFADMPKVLRVPLHEATVTGRATMLDFAHSRNCLVCKKPIEGTGTGVCSECRTKTLESAVTLRTATREAQSKAMKVLKLCRVCCSGGEPLINFEAGSRCDSQDCPMYYTKIKATREFELLQSAQNRLIEQLEW